MSLCITVFMYLCIYSVAELHAKWLPMTKHLWTFYVSIVRCSQCIKTKKGKRVQEFSVANSC